MREMKRRLLLFGLLGLVGVLGVVSGSSAALPPLWGTAIEVPLRVRLKVDLIKRKKISWPRFENDSTLMAVGAYRPLDDALRIAFTELIGWIHAETTLSELDAYQLLSQVGKLHVTEMVDPNYVVIASVEKKYLPPRKSGKPW